MKTAKIAVQNEYLAEKPHKPSFVVVKHKEPKEIKLTMDELLCCMYATD